MRPARLPLLLVSMLLAAGVSAIGLLAWWLLAHDPSDAVHRVGMVHVEPRVGTRSDDASSRDGDETTDETMDESVPTRRVVPAPAIPIVPLDLAAARRLERSGRAEFFGTVRDSKGAPVDGATLFHAGNPIARSDAAGQYRVEVPHDVSSRANVGDRSIEALLAAFKPGVGAACVLLWGPSRRLDLVLEPGGTLVGRVVDRESGAPVAAAELDLLARPSFALDSQIAFAESASGDADGRFEFGHLPQGSFELRARAAGRDSIGFYSFAFDGVRSEVEFFVDATLRVRGWFDPWPPPGQRESAQAIAKAAQVTAWAGSAPGRWFDVRRHVSPVDEQGRFELELPTGNPVDLGLVSGDALLWTDALDVGPSGADVDFGRIALVEGATVVARVALPADVLELGCKVDGVLENSWGATTFERDVPADGRLRIGPLPTGGLRLQIRLGRQTLIAKGMSRGGDGEPRGEAIPLERGRVADLGELAPARPVLVGRVVDESGTPCARAEVELRLDGDPEVAMTTIADAEGCFTIEVSNLDVELPERDEAAFARAVAGRLTLGASTRGRALRFEATAAPPLRGVLRHDLKLAGGRTIRGTLVDEQGAPCIGHALHFRRRDGPSRGTYDVTSADGSFEIAGLDPAEFDVNVVDPEGGERAFPIVEVGTTDAPPLHLSLADATVVWSRPGHATAAR